ncbi:hypothetical protein SAMN04488542_106157 [Fontibacillus panacisegetis]|uniref:Uncharacterized protein n=1 Tax=Fontibacillus panacisegetis TaxID=670482 RepID=A0A1G7IVZ0_9BACL|nr:hypothetical protein [Fontibacillus panacisegetis]SDF16813.1 hypothetical protein SAMN04488542_106157 [Fontibacillus panacisegetis]
MKRRRGVVIKRDMYEDMEDLKSIGTCQKDLLCGHYPSVWEMSLNTNNALPTSYWEAKGLKSSILRYLEFCKPFESSAC